MVATKKGKNWGSKLIWLHKKGETRALIITWLQMKVGSWALINIDAHESGKVRFESICMAAKETVGKS
jgi:hypothetical protein